MWVGRRAVREGGTQVTRSSTTTSGSCPSTGSSARSRGSTFDSAVTCSPATAPDDIAAFTPTFIDGEQGMEVKVGDPNTTITGRHRYVLDYELPRDVLLDAADTLAWDAVGTKWTVDIQRRRSTSWRHGPRGAIVPRRHRRRRGGCELREVEPGHLVTEVEGPRARRGRHRRAERGAPRSPPPRRAATADHGPPTPASGCSCRPSRPPPPASAARSPPRCSSAARAVSAWASAASPTLPSPGAGPHQRGAARRSRAGRDGHHRLRRPRAHPAQGGLLHAETVRRPTRWPG